MENVRWGILGTGRMATVMAGELTAMRAEGIELVAVASRNVQSAKSFARRYGIHRAWGSYAELAADAGVDAVYVATPHSLHHDNILACLRGGKAVLCEKPFTLSAPQARAVIDEARGRGLFIMEAMWTRFLPAVVALRKLLQAGAIGRVQMIIGGGAFVPDFGPEHYLLNKDLGGGVLLDAGVYLVSMASMILGTPTRIQASGIIGSLGVDEQDAILLEHANGSAALLYVSLRARRSPDLEILGESGRISIAAPIFKPAKLTVWNKDGVATVTEYPVSGTGYGYQIREAAEALRAGRRESTVMPLDETLSIMQTMDTIRRQIGLRYAGEK
jgi:predicted dehydrogenase